MLDINKSNLDNCIKNFFYSDKSPHTVIERATKNLTLENLICWSDNQLDVLKALENEVTEECEIEQIYEYEKELTDIMKVASKELQEKTDYESAMYHNYNLYESYGHYSF